MSMVFCRNNHMVDTLLNKFGEHSSTVKENRIYPQNWNVSN